MTKLNHLNKIKLYLNLIQKPYIYIYIYIERERERERERDDPKLYIYIHTSLKYIS